MAVAPTIPVGERTAESALVGEPVSSVDRAVLDGLGLAARADELRRIEGLVCLLALISTCEVRLLAFEAHVEQVLLHSEARGIVEVGAVGVHDGRILVATFVLQTLQSTLLDGHLERIDGGEDRSESGMLNVLFAQRTKKRKGTEIEMSGIPCPHAESSRAASCCVVSCVTDHPLNSNPIRAPGQLDSSFLSRQE